MLTLAGALILTGQPTFAQDAAPKAAPVAAPAPINANGDMEKWEDYTAADPKKVPQVEGGKAPIGYWLNMDAYETGQTPDFAIKGMVARDTQIKHGGTSSVRIENGLATDITEISLPPFAVKPNSRYLVKVWIKGEGIALHAGDGTGASVWVNTGPEKDYWSHQTALLQQPPKKDGDFEWTLLEIPIETAPNTGMMAVLLQLRRATGKVWFDDLEVLPQGEIKKAESF